MKKETKATDINYLLNRKRKGLLTEAEQEQLHKWLAVHPEQAGVIAQTMNDITKQEAAVERMSYYAQMQSLESFKSQYIKKPVHFRRYLLRWSAAAVLCAAVGLFLWKADILSPKRTTHPVEQAVYIKPAASKAIFEVVGGAKIDLDNMGINETKEVDGLLLTKNEEGVLIYRWKDDMPKGMTTSKIKTPKGGFYHIQLTDGTLVHLAAESTLEFPTRFEGDVRRVRLDGEAFFTVAKVSNGRQERVPFLLEVPGQEIEVLGTTFNVVAYPEGTINRTTLIEGKVRVKTPQETKELRPGQQAVVDRSTRQVEIHTISKEATRQWKEDVFLFDGESIEEIMDKIARWYDMEVIYVDKPSKEMLSGMASKYQSPETVLRLLELTGNVKFRIEGRRVFVMN